MKRKCLFLFLWFSLFVFAFWLGAWTAWAEGYAHYTPEYAKVDVEPVIQKENLEESDYQLLLRQTGLGRSGVDELRQNGRQNEMLYLQDRFFAEVETVCLRDLFIVQSERLLSVEMPRIIESAEHEVPVARRREVQLTSGVVSSTASDFLPTVQTGDILISFNGHIFGWRNGHAAIVVDAEKGVTLEAITLGSDSRICDIEKWAEYPCFALLRLNGATAEQRAEIAGYAMENLVGVSYRLFSFSGDSKVDNHQSLVNDSENVAEVVREPLTGTHCSHLVWSAYARYGYDLDSDGGWVVTPRDIFDSDLLEVVQIYGLDPVAVDRK